MTKTFERFSTNDEKISILKKFFNYKYLIYCLIGILISMIEIKFNSSNIILPFTTAYIIAVISNEIPAIGIILVTFITAAIQFKSKGIVAFLIQMIIFILSLGIIKPRQSINDSEKYKFGKRLVLVTILSSLIIYMKEYSFYAGFELLVFNLSVSYIFYKISANALNIIKNRRIFSEIEYISLTILIAISLFIFKEVKIINMNVAIWLGILSSMYISKKCTVKYSTFLGIINGIFYGLYYNKRFDLIIYFLIISVISSLLKKVNKWVIFGINLVLLISYLIISKYYNLSNIILIEIICALPVLLFNKTLIKKVEIKEENKLLEDMRKIEAPRKSDEFYRFYSSFNNKLNSISDNIFYKYLKNNENLTENIFKEIKSKMVLLEEDLIEIFEKNNIILSTGVDNEIDEIQYLNIKNIKNIINDCYHKKS